MLQRLRANPRPVVLIIIAVVIVGAFFAVVAPLFDTSGGPSAQLAGALPESVTAGKQFEIDVALDNTGVSVLDATCIAAHSTRPVHLGYAIFQGLDRESFARGSVCGGALSGGETISVQLFLTALDPGTMTLSLLPVRGSQQLGSGLQGSIRVVSR